MERYDNIARMEEIRICIDNGEYTKANRIIESVDINKLKSLTDLSIVADVYTQNGRFENAMEILMRIYSKTKTRRILYQLVDLSIKRGNTVDAEEYLEKYIKAAPNDFYHFIFRYYIDRINGASYDVLIASLEQLKEYEYIEKWAYELAKLYHKAGMKDKCVRECSDIALWFGDGLYVEKAKLLKAYYVGEINPITMLKTKEKKEAEIRLGMDKTKDYSAMRSQIDEFLQEEEAGKKIAEANDYTEEIERNNKVVEFKHNKEITQTADEKEEYAEKEYVEKEHTEKEFKEEYTEKIYTEEENTEEEYAEEYTEEANEVSIEAIPASPFARENEFEEEILNSDKTLDSNKTLDSTQTENYELDLDPAGIVDHIPVSLKENQPDNKVIADFDVEAVLRKELTSMNEEFLDEEKEDLDQDLNQNSKKDLIKENDQELAFEEKKDSISEIVASKETVDSSIIIEPSMKEEDSDDVEPTELQQIYLASGIDYKEIFGYYLHIKDCKSQIELCLENLVKDNTKNNHMIINGDRRSGKTTLAKKFSKILGLLNKIDVTKVAKITTEKLNKINLEQKKDVLADQMLIIEDAGLLKEETVEQLLHLIWYLDGHLFVVLEDTKNNLEALFQKYPKLSAEFDNKINLPTFSKQDLFGFAKSYIEERDYQLSKEAEIIVSDYINRLENGLKEEERLETLMKNMKLAKTAADNRNKQELLKIVQSRSLSPTDLMMIKKEDLKHMEVTQNG